MLLFIGCGLNRDSVVGRVVLDLGARGYGCEITSGEITALRGVEQGQRERTEWKRPIHAQIQSRTVLYFEFVYMINLFRCFVGYVVCIQVKSNQGGRLAVGYYMATG